jgi:uncharacterized membrane protein
MAVRTIVEALFLLLAWGACLAVRPWRMLRRHDGQPRPLVTPFLACLTVLPWLWSWPGLTALSLPLQWSGAPLVTLLVGWPLAVPVITVAGLATLLTAGASPAHALAVTVWSGLLPATLMLVLGHAVRRALGANPVAYLLGRAFLLPMVILAACGFSAAILTHGLQGPTGELQRVAVALLAMGEAAWTAAILSLLVACRPAWIATWSPALYLRQPARRPVRTQPPAAR